jgi:ribulose-5-phosphate 4-epimerase/fuculose-1-phosphate aldolase
MHIGVLKAVAEFDVILHFQSPAATALACGRFDKYYFDVLPEIPFYIGKVSNVPFAMPGSAELAGSVVEAMADGAGMVVLQNHGLVTGGKHYDEAIQRAVFFEMACDVLLRQKDIVGLSEGEVKQIRDSKKV